MAALGATTGNLALILDVDDVLLKEVAYERRGSECVQRLRYRPSEETAARYRRRLAEPAAADGASKCRHFRFEADGSLVSAVVARPGIADLIARLNE